ncbi:hypothetical protein V3C99_002190 [Haemonchus contortus]
MLLGLLTLLLVSSQCVSDIHNSTFSKYRCEFTSMCCTRDFVNIPVAIVPKLTSQASVPDRCFPFEALIYRFDNSTAQQCKSMMTNATTPFTNKSECTDESPLNSTKTKDEPNTDEVYLKDSSREEFRKMRRFHFGREVPVLGICLCVILDCVLIALVCFAVHLDEEEENEEEFDEFVSFEDVDEAPTRQEVETQTSPQKLPVVSHVDRGVQTEMPVTEKPSDKIFAVKLDQPRQSEC